MNYSDWVKKFALFSKRPKHRKVESTSDDLGATENSKVLSDLLDAATAKSKVELQIQEIRKQTLLECIREAGLVASDCDRLARSHAKNSEDTLTIAAICKSHGAELVCQRLLVKLLREFPDVDMNQLF